MVVGAAMVMTPPLGRGIRGVGFHAWSTGLRPDKAGQSPPKVKSMSVDPLHRPLLSGLMIMLVLCVTRRLLCLLAQVDIADPVLRGNLMQIFILQNGLHA